MSSLRSLAVVTVLAAGWMVGGRAYGTDTRLRAIDPPSLPPPHGYSHVVVAPPGQAVSISGQVALDPAGNLVGAGNFARQCRQAFTNLGLALKSVGLGFEDLTRTDMYITDASDLPALRACRAQFLPASHAPASTLVVVKSLYRPDLLIEVAADAVLPAGGTQGQ